MVNDLKVHHIKLDIKYCDDVLCRRKSFEIRYNDRKYEAGDRIIFIPVKNGKALKHDISKIQYSIIYILDNFIGLQDGYIAFSMLNIGLI